MVEFKWKHCYVVHACFSESLIFLESSHLAVLFLLLLLHFLNHLDLTLADVVEALTSNFEVLPVFLQLTELLLRDFVMQDRLLVLIQLSNVHLVEPEWSFFVEAALIHHV